MSIKNDIEMVKEELTSEEKFFEKSVMTERFVKKYKGMIIGGVVAVTVLIAGNFIYESNKESTILAANEALEILNKDSKNADALANLEKLSPSLYDAFKYSMAIAEKDMQTLNTLKSSQAMLIGDLATYETAKDAGSLTAYTLEQDTIYKDLAQVQGAILLLNDGKTQQAHEKLALISESSSLAQVAKALSHYGVK